MANLTILEAFRQTLSATKKYVNNRIDGLASETYVNNAIAGFASKADPSFTGNVTVAGKVTVGAAPTEDKDLTTKKYVDEKIAEVNTSGGYTHPNTHPASMITGLATVATSGNYNDLTNKPIIPSTDGLATETYVNTKVSELVDSAPETLDTLKELSTALGNDPNFATTISNQIGSKVDKVEGKSLVLNTEIAKIHEHGNKDLLDTIEADNVHTHSNKSVIDAITSDMTTKWNKSIPFENTYISDCDTWLTNGYTKTSTETTNHPSVCTGQDKWGVLFYISEDANNGTGTQMYFPIAGAYAGRVFTRNITNRSAGVWNLVSTFDGNYDSLTNKPTIPTVTNDLTNALKSNYDTAYTHSQSAHAPVNAQKNSDITKAEIEAKLTGDVTTHTHSQYLTEHQSLTGYATEEFVNNRLSSLQIVPITQADYDALTTKDPNTLYLITTTNAGSIDSNNHITLSSDLPSGRYTLKYEDENGQPLSDFEDITIMEV